MQKSSRKSALMASLAGAFLAATACQSPAAAAESVVEAPVPTRASQESGGLKNAYFAGGCFWGVEAVFSHMKGVKSVVSGYHGGNGKTADYSTVSTGTTEHAESVKVVYDPKVVRYDQLLQVMFSVVADPTLKNRQGPDTGPQYRAAIIPVSDEQRAVAESYLRQMRASGTWNKPIVVGIENARQFYKAEDYHQDFAAKNPGHPYIQRWDAPKVEAFARMFPSLYSPAFQKG